MGWLTLAHVAFILVNRAWRNTSIFQQSRLMFCLHLKKSGCGPVSYRTVSLWYTWTMYILAFVLIVYQTRNIFAVCSFYSAPKLALQSQYMLGHIRPSVHPSLCHTPLLCQNEETQRDAVLPPSSPGVSSFLMLRMINSGWSCPGKIWVQRGRPVWKQPSCTCTHFAS